MFISKIIKPCDFLLQDGLTISNYKIGQLFLTYLWLETALPTLFKCCDKDLIPHSTYLYTQQSIIKIYTGVVDYCRNDWLLQACQVYFSSHYLSNAYFYCWLYFHARFWNIFHLIAIYSCCWNQICMFTQKRSRLWSDHVKQQVLTEWPK